MKSEIKFEDWIKLNLRVGEIIENKNKIKINLGNKVLETNRNLDVKKGEKIVVGIQEENLIIPLIKNSVIIPDGEIENGSRIS